MDETSYSDPRVIAAVNEHFVPVRVDNDRHPDVNRRYNMGGWPTTAFLAASGDVLTGGTYLPPDQMLESLARVKAFFDANQAKILALEGERASDGDGAALANLTGCPLKGELALEALEGDPDVPGDISAEVALQVVRGFDPVGGGLGVEPKFPQPDVFGFMLVYGCCAAPTIRSTCPRAAVRSCVRRAYTRSVRTTLTAMAERRAVRPRRGRLLPLRHAARLVACRTTRRCSRTTLVLRRLYLEALAACGGHDLGDPERTCASAEGAIDYLLATLWRDDVPAFGGSQDADENYYLLDAGGPGGPSGALRRSDRLRRLERAGGAGPVPGASVLGRPELADRAVQLLDHLCEKARHGDAMAHFVHPDGAVGDGAPLLGDQAATATALLDAYEATAERRWLRRARSLARWACEHLCAPDGRLVDRVAVPGQSAGLLAQPVPALDENAAMAEVLLRLEAYTGEARLREQALGILAGWAPFYEQYGVAAAAYAQTSLRYLERPDQIVIVGARGDDEARPAARRRARRTAADAHRPVARPGGSARRRADARGRPPRRSCRGRLRLPRPHLFAVPPLSGIQRCCGISSRTLCYPLTEGR